MQGWGIFSYPLSLPILKSDQRILGTMVMTLRHKVDGRRSLCGTLISRVTNLPIFGEL